MKLIYAGQGELAKPYTELLFNCTRNARCQREFFVPVNDFSDIVFYADLPGKPTLIEIEVMNVCDIENVGSAVSIHYVVGKTNEQSWYGVFGNLVVTPPVGVTYNKFFFKFSFTILGGVHVFYSEQYEFPFCDNLTPIKGCYPDEAVGSDSFDCNGIYYGFPNNEDFLGFENYRYYHSAFLRLASIIEQRNRMTFAAFNSKKIYKTDFVREWLLESEIVPTFYKDVIIGILNRGNIRVNTTGSFKEWKLAETQDIAIVDTDSKLWRMDILLDQECKQSFGCDNTVCEFVPPIECCTPPIISATQEEVMGANKLTIVFDTEFCDPAPDMIRVYYRETGSAGAYAMQDGFTTSPIEILDTLENYEGYIVGVCSGQENGLISTFSIGCINGAFASSYSEENEELTLDIGNAGSYEWVLVNFTDACTDTPLLSGIQPGLTPLVIPWDTPGEFKFCIRKICGETFSDWLSGNLLEVTEGEVGGGSAGMLTCPDIPEAITDITFDGVSVVPTVGIFPILPGESISFMVTNPNALGGTLVAHLLNNTSGQPVHLQVTDSNGFTQCIDGIGGSTRTLLGVAIDPDDFTVTIQVGCGICP